MTVIYNANPGPVHKVLRQLELEAGTAESKFYISLSEVVLDPNEAGVADKLSVQKLDPLKDLPSEKPAHIIASGFQMRRAAPKLGRNDPCHCGSGKKYKKCCIQKDEERLRDSSPYEGVTMTEARAMPSKVGDPYLIEKLRPEERLKLNPNQLSDEQLHMAYDWGIVDGLLKVHCRLI